MCFVNWFTVGTTAQHQYFSDYGENGLVKHLYPLLYEPLAVCCHRVEVKAPGNSNKIMARELFNLPRSKRPMVNARSMDNLNFLQSR